MKDIIFVKAKKDNESERRKFAKDNSSFFVNKEFDSITRPDSKTRDFFNYTQKIGFINRLLFNFFTFATIILSAFLLIVILSISGKAIEVKNRLQFLSVSGMKSIEQGGENLINFDNDKAAEYFKQAFLNLEQANEELTQKKLLQASVSITPIVREYQKNFKYLLDTAKDVSLAGFEVSQIMKEVSSPAKEKSPTFTQNLKNRIRTMNEKIKTAETSLLKIDTKYLDEKTASKIEKVKTNLPEINKYLKIISSAVEKSPQILGFDEEKNYLLLFQNNNELRSTGGFIGSFGILKVARGEIKEIFIDDVYKLDRFYAAAIQRGEENYIPPPYPMDPSSTGNWAFRDSNLNPDFSKASTVILDFYGKEIKYAPEKKYPEKIDGIIGVTPTVLEEVLKILGPINLDEYGLTLSHENLLETLQMEVESGKDKKEKQNPKTILEVLKNKLLERTESLKKEKTKQILALLFSKLNEKHILLYFKDNELEDLAKRLKWAGEVENKDSQDFLMVVNNNFGGGKSSLKIKEFIEQEVNIKEDGSLTNSVKITREHTSDYYLKYRDPWSGKEMWLVGENNNYIKIYTPKGSRLIKAQGFESKVDIYDEIEKTAFGSYFSLAPKQKKTASLSYESPFKVNVSGGNYSLLVQKQPGTLNSEIIVKVKLPGNLKVEKTNGIIEDGSFIFKNTLTEDRFFFLNLAAK